MVKYYYANGQRVVMRVGSTLYYLLNDHLGSTAITANSSGGKTAELRYKAYGETRYSEGTRPRPTSSPASGWMTARGCTTTGRATTTRS